MLAVAERVSRVPVATLARQRWEVGDPALLTVLGLGQVLHAL